METSTIKNIIFDLGGVILNIDYQKTATAFKNLGLSHFDELYSQFQQNNLFDELEKGLITDEQFISEIRKALPSATTDIQITDAWNAMLLDLPQQRVKLLQGANTRYRIFLLSNTNSIHYSAYMRYFDSAFGLDFNALFEVAYYSHDIKLRKPDTACFEYVLTASSLHKDETLFIDDSLQHIHSAAAFGINTYHHTAGCLTGLFTSEGKLLPNLLT